MQLTGICIVFPVNFSLDTMLVLRLHDRRPVLRTMTILQVAPSPDVVLWIALK